MLSERTFQIVHYLAKSTIEQESNGSFVWLTV